MLPLRYDLHWIGGSWAQRQIFNSTIIEAAVRVGNVQVAIGLVAELAERKPQNQRLQTLLRKLKATQRNRLAEPPAKRTKLL